MRFVVLAVLVAIVSCGKSSDTSNYNVDGCVTTAATTGKSVYYNGSKYGKFESGKDYVGKVLSVLNGGTVEIDWTAFKSVENEGNLKFEATCTPPLVGKRAYYAGSKYGKFESGKDYVGNVLAVFNDGYLQVVWDAGFSTVESKSNLNIEK